LTRKPESDFREDRDESHADREAMYQEYLRSQAKRLARLDAGWADEMGNR
jgi:hypothetical protein